jgi:NarL family two-component system sensor histidine kinase LiaS
MALVIFVIVLSLSTMGQLAFVLTLGQSSVWRGDLQATTAELAHGAGDFLGRTPVNLASLEAWMGATIPTEDWAVIVSPAGELLAANTKLAADEARAGRPVADPVAPEESTRLIGQALAGTGEILGLPDGIVLAVEPITGEGEEVVGALYVRLVRNALFPGTFLGGTLQILGIATAAFTVAAIVVGTFAGLAMARGFIRRLRSLDAATRAWGAGDFSAKVHDNSPDEIGQLTRRMGRMAEQVQGLLRTRQDLATLEERNRLARDLHDSVKQQVFAATMTLGAAKTLRAQDPDSAWQKVDEAMDLSLQAQQELTGLIYELRPVLLEGRDLAAALREYGARWSRQSGMAFSMDARGERDIPAEVEQALFRVAQESLSNVSRHSDASRVRLKLLGTRHVVMLEIADDGRGFDPATTAPGMGLSTMRERVERVGGTLAVDCRPGGGTRVLARCKIG